ncbi:uncharacterized protein LOC120321562 [Drosophila yakuba]|uniref:uncharacterized protein LOC120321562 n=1 Tax=Drosophila yakuba TaxID=7245 RepID=UPI0019308687|nr:uncharacterized protein LOC120321562 [Drosophila yakuba]
MPPPEGRKHRASGVIAGGERELFVPVIWSRRLRADLKGKSWASVSGGCQPAHGSRRQPSNGPKRSGFPRRRLIPRSKELLHFSWSSSVRSGFPRRRPIPGSRELLHFSWGSSMCRR